MPTLPMGVHRLLLTFFAVLSAARLNGASAKRRLLEKDPLGARTDHSVLHIAVLDGLPLEGVRALIANGEDVHQGRGDDGATALHIAAWKGISHLDVMKALLASGARVDQQESSGTTPLYYAAQHGE